MPQFSQTFTVPATGVTPSRGYQNPSATVDLGSIPSGTNESFPFIFKNMSSAGGKSFPQRLTVSGVTGTGVATVYGFFIDGQSTTVDNTTKSIVLEQGEEAIVVVKADRENTDTWNTETEAEPAPVSGSIILTAEWSDV